MDCSVDQNADKTVLDARARVLSDQESQILGFPTVLVRICTLHVPYMYVRPVQYVSIENDARPNP
jgi:hypothetical protein